MFILNRVLRGAYEEKLSAISNFENIYRKIRGIRLKPKKTSLYVHPELKLIEDSTKTCLGKVVADMALKIRKF